MNISAGLLTGYLVMKTFMKQKKGAEAMAFGGQMEVIHVIDGRLRIRSERFKSEKLGQAVVAQLTRINGIDKVVPTQLTGSLLVEYDSNKVDKDLLIGAIIKLIGLEEQLSMMQNSKVYKEIHLANKAVNKAMLDKTAGYLDLKTMLPITFIGAAVYRILSTQEFTTPSSATLLWWAYNDLNLGGK